MLRVRGRDKIARSRAIIVVIIMAIMFFLVVVVKIGGQDGNDDPDFDPLNNPMVHVAKIAPDPLLAFQEAGPGVP